MELVKAVSASGPLAPQSVHDFAVQYAEQGLAIVPIPKGKKHPVMANWQSFKCAPDQVYEQFSNADSIGLILGTSGLVDVDFDSQETIAFAHLFPQTAAISRHSKAISHYLYYSSYDGQMQFLDPTPDKGLLLELRGGNRCVLAPPSMHPHGEQLVWNGIEFAHVSIDLLKERASMVAAFALIARYWPPKNSVRHAAGLAVGGVMARAGLTEEIALKAMQSIAKFSKDEEPEDRVTAVKDSYKKYSASIPITGLPTLAQFFEDKVASRFTNGSAVPKPIRHRL